MFSNVQVLIYVLDVEKEGKPYEDELQDYRNMIENLSEFSPEAIVFVLIHKFDKIKENDKKIVFEVPLLIMKAQILRCYEKG